jgi:hypothetical protein
MDVVVPVKRGERVIDIRVRTVAKPDNYVAMFLSKLGLQLPNGSKRTQNVMEKTTRLSPQPVDYKQPISDNCGTQANLQTKLLTRPWVIVKYEGNKIVSHRPLRRRWLTGYTVLLGSG